MTSLAQWLNITHTWLTVFNFLHDWQPWATPCTLPRYAHVPRRVWKTKTCHREGTLFADKLAYPDELFPAWGHLHHPDWQLHTLSFIPQWHTQSSKALTWRNYLLRASTRSRWQCEILRQQTVSEGNNREFHTQAMQTTAYSINGRQQPRNCQILIPWHH